VNVYTALATLAFLLIFTGSAQYKKRAVHVPLVLAGILVDLTLVLILEFQRDVIGMTISTDWSWMQWTHIGSSILAVLLYLPVTWLGVAILRGKTTRTTRSNHKRLAIAALVCRTVGFGFMWAV
jgi:hypothetical protein